MSRSHPVLMMWITVGVLLGVPTASVGVGGVGTATASSPVGITVDHEAFLAADGVFVDERAVAAAQETTEPSGGPVSGESSTAGLLVLIVVVLIIATGAIVLTLKYRKR